MTAIIVTLTICGTVLLLAPIRMFEIGMLGKKEVKDMTDTGMTRPIDALGRITIPVETRRRLGLQPGDELAIWTEGDRIILQKDSAKDRLESLLSQALFVSTYTEATHEAKDLIRALYAIAGGESDENSNV